MLIEQITERVKMGEWLVFDDENLTPPTTLTTDNRDRLVFENAPYIQAVCVDDDIYIMLAHYYCGEIDAVENTYIHHYNKDCELVDSCHITPNESELEILKTTFDNWCEVFGTGVTNDNINREDLIEGLEISIEM